MSPQPDRLPHLETSVLALAGVALQETSATGFALFRRTDETPGLLRVVSLGTEISSRALLQGETLALVAFPLHTGDEQDGLAAFSFEDRAASDRAREALTRLRSNSSGPLAFPIRAILTSWKGSASGKHASSLQRLQTVRRDSWQADADRIPWKPW